MNTLSFGDGVSFLIDPAPLMSLWTLYALVAFGIVAGLSALEIFRKDTPHWQRLFLATVAIAGFLAFSTTNYKALRAYVNRRHAVANVLTMHLRDLGSPPAELTTLVGTLRPHDFEQVAQLHLILDVTVVLAILLIARPMPLTWLRRLVESVRERLRELT